MKQKYPIVILPGWMLGAYRFEKLAQEFEKYGHKTYTVDFPGFERGEKIVRPWFLNDYVDFLERYLEQKKLKKVIFVCHSFGGRVALKLVTNYPKQVVALIISGTPGFTPITQSRLKTFVWLAKLGGMFFSVPILKLVKNEARKLYYWLAGAKEYYHADGFMRETFKYIVAENLESSMKKITLPTLLLWGNLDTIVPVRIAEKMQTTIQNSKLIVIPDTGHMVPAREPQKFVKETENYLSKIS